MKTFHAHTKVLVLLPEPLVKSDFVHEIEKFEIENIEIIGC